MDKTEYQLKLDELNHLVESQDYRGALELAESIEWRRVKSVRTLCMVADVYEVNGMLEKSMKMLQLAYKRSSIGKTVLYRQVELALKMNDNEAAVQYYNKYLELCSNDTTKYILKYKILKAQNAPLEEQIAVLEAYKDREYTERWVYELANLYKKAGKENRCIETCDDLILWFGEGKYVTKAMELKKSYVPLSASQQLRYNQVKEGTGKVADVMPTFYQPAQQVQPVEKEPEEATEELQEAAATVEEPAVKVDPVALQERLSKSFQEVLAGFNRGKVVSSFEALGRSVGSEMPEEPQEEENIEEYQVEELEPETANEAKISAEKGEAIELRVEEPVKQEEPVVEDSVEKEKEELTAEQVESEIPTLEELDLESLFAETAKILSENAQKKEEPQEEEPVEESVIAEEVVTEKLDEEPVAAEEDVTLEEVLGEGTVEELEEQETDANPDFLPEIDLDIVNALAGEKTEEEPEAKEVADELSELETIIANQEPVAEKNKRILDATRPEKFTEEQKRLFTYFSKVPGMDEQILDAIFGVYAHANEKTSRRGNVAIMGSQGTGKSKLSESLVKAICKELGLEAVKYARMDSLELNSRNPATIVGKMAGGFLLIERAGYMTDHTIEELSRAMDFRTDGMVVILEDEKTRMRKLLSDYPEFAERFETVISIPVFTNDELVTFARTYAKENGYRMDELGVLALYTLIGENQREDEPITVARVKKMVDGAIQKAQGSRIGKKVSKRRIDEDGRILLFEKDFEA